MVDAPNYDPRGLRMVDCLFSKDMEYHMVFVDISNDNAPYVIIGDVTAPDEDVRFTMSYVNSHGGNKNDSLGKHLNDRVYAPERITPQTSRKFVVDEEKLRTIRLRGVVD